MTALCFGGSATSVATRTADRPKRYLFAVSYAHRLTEISPHYVEPEAAVNLMVFAQAPLACYFMMQTTMSDRPQAPAAADDDASPGTLESTLSAALDTTSTVALSSIIRDALLRGEDITNTFRRSHNANDDDRANGDNKANGETYEESSLQSTLASQHFIYDDVHSKILTADILGGDIKLDPLEKRAIYREIHGRVASDDEDEAMHGRIEQLEREIWKLPKEDKAALMRVLRKNPLLFVVSSQTKLFLSSEDFDAPRAARRIARYWQRREDLFGEDNVLKDGDVPSPNLEDYDRFYSRCEDILEDADADEEGLAIARDYIHAVDHQKIKAMDQVVAQALDKRKDILKWLIECKLIRHEKQNSSGDLSMVIAGSSEEKMRFIRSESFIEKKAASRLVKYWSYKYELFGPGRGTQRANEDSSGQLSCDLSKKILLDDDRMAGCPELLDRGFFRIVPDTDAFGRIIVVFNMKKLTDVFDEINEGDGETIIIKSIWYVLQTASERRECQRSGMVFLANLRGGNSDLLYRFKLRAACRDILLRCMPIRVKAFHFFFPPSQSWWQEVIYALFKHAEPLYRKHAIIHTGSSEEHELAELEKCGLPKIFLPVEVGGDA